MHSNEPRRALVRRASISRPWACGSSRRMKPLQECQNTGGDRRELGGRGSRSDTAADEGRRDQCAPNLRHGDTHTGLIRAAFGVRPLLSQAAPWKHKPVASAWGDRSARRASTSIDCAFSVLARRDTISSCISKMSPMGLSKRSAQRWLLVSASISCTFTRRRLAARCTEPSRHSERSTRVRASLRR